MAEKLKVADALEQAVQCLLSLKDSIKELTRPEQAAHYQMLLTTLRTLTAAKHAIGAQQTLNVQIHEDDFPCDIDFVKTILLWLDILLTGVKKRDAENNMRKQAVETVATGAALDYKLSDGESRIWLVPVEGRVDLQGISSAKVKESWTHGDVRALVDKLKDALTVTA